MEEMIKELFCYDVFKNLEAAITSYINFTTQEDGEEPDIAFHFNIDHEDNFLHAAVENALSSGTINMIKVDGSLTTCKYGLRKLDCTVELEIHLSADSTAPMNLYYLKVVGFTFHSQFNGLVSKNALALHYTYSALGLARQKYAEIVSEYRDFANGFDRFHINAEEAFIASYFDYLTDSEKAADNMVAIALQL
jgi:hypothetical protein